MFYSQLFGEEDEEEGSEALEAALQAGETNQTEVDSLNQQASGFKSLRRAFSQSSEPLDGIARMAFEKVFHHDIKTLLGMSDMWKSRTPPTVLEFDKIRADNVAQNGHRNGVNGTTSQQLQDQRELSVGDCLDLFVSRYVFLPSVSRLISPLYLVPIDWQHG